MMNFMDWYPGIRLAHMALVAMSGALFFARGVGVLLGGTWSLNKGVRRISVLIDSALLGAALLLLHLLQLNPWVEGWLATKMGLLLIYIVLGTLALRRARTVRMRAACFVGALLCLGFMVSVAQAHHPLGLLSRM